VVGTQKVAPVDKPSKVKRQKDNVDGTLESAQVGIKMQQDEVVNVPQATLAGSGQRSTISTNAAQNVTTEQAPGVSMESGQLQDLSSDPSFKLAASQLFIPTQDGLTGRMIVLC